MKKKVNIILLFVVIILWGVVIYRYVGHYFLSETIPNSSYLKDDNYAKYIIRKKDTFTPQVSSRDPFLGRIALSSPQKVILNNSQKRSVVKEVNVSKKQVIFPLIRYYGFIKAAEQKDEVVLLGVDGKFVRLKARQEFKGLSIVQHKKDSIEVSFNKERKWFTQTTR